MIFAIVICVSSSILFSTSLSTFLEYSIQLKLWISKQFWLVNTLQTYYLKFYIQDEVNFTIIISILGIYFNILLNFTLGILLSLGISLNNKYTSVLLLATTSSFISSTLSNTITYNLFIKSFSSDINKYITYYIILNSFIGYIVSVISILRLDSLLFLHKNIPRVSFFDSSQLIKRLRIWLALDWEKGLGNANQILKYSKQFISVSKAIKQLLSNTPESLLISRTAKLSDLIYDLDILYYLFAPLETNFIKKIWHLGYLQKGNNNFYYDNYSQIISSGFWYLYEAKLQEDRYDCIFYLKKSEQVFANLRHIENGEELYQLVSILIKLLKIESIEAISEFKINTSVFLSSESLRPMAWEYLEKLISAIKEIRIINNSKSSVSKSFALNRAFGYISEVTENINLISPELFNFEISIIEKIAVYWRDLLLPIASQIGQIEIDRPVNNPYIIGDPVIGDRFIGREDILRQLEEHWFINTTPQSVILYGHRRMGKTSILLNATTKVNPQVRVAYVNLLSSGSAPNGITDILMAICDAIQKVTEITVPSNNDLLQFPETTFRRYLEQVTKNFTGAGLIIALDEFEKIEELIDAGKLSKDFLGFLRGMVQMSSKLAFAFAGLHTLQEMNADYFQPFFASFIPISVTFLNRGATHQILANPDPEFLLEYEPAASEYIYDLTNGQPYLTQLVGFQLVRYYNDYEFEQGRPRDLTIDNVRSICSSDNFFNTGIHYFNGVWQQASEGAAHQQDILKALAPYPQGLTESELISQTNLPSETLQAALKTLKDHDVIRSQKTNEIVNWAIAVELFRNWVVKYKLM